MCLDRLFKCAFACFLLSLKLIGNEISVGKKIVLGHIPTISFVSLAHDNMLTVFILLQKTRHILTTNMIAHACTLTNKQINFPGLQ